MHRKALLKLLEHHATRFMEEAAYRARAIAYVRDNPECFSRKLWPAHVTGSTWIVDPSREKVLLLHHRKHNRWFQPGGHADGDPDVIRVALKEANEETGIAPGNLRLVDPALFDLDIHTIEPKKGDPRHEHIDCRFLVEADDRLPIPGNAESWEVRWVPLWEVARFNRDRSIHRMLEKTRRLRMNA